MLDLRRLNLLRELSVLGTIGKVAEASQLTRAAISQQLTILEQEMGVTLFERSGRGVKLTSAGNRLVARTAELFEIVESIEAEKESFQTDVTGEIRISAFGSAAGFLLPPIIKRLEEMHPRLAIFVYERESIDCLKAVASKQGDLALFDSRLRVDPLLHLVDSELLCSDRFVAVLPADHALSQSKRIFLSDLSKEKWALNMASEPYHSLLMEACAASGFAPDIRVSCRNILATLNYVSRNGYVTIQPSFNLHGINLSTDVAVLPFSPDMMRNVAVAFSRGSTARPPIAAVLMIMREVVRSLTL